MHAMELPIVQLMLPRRGFDMSGAQDANGVTGGPGKTVIAGCVSIMSPSNMDVVQPIEPNG